VILSFSRFPTLILISEDDSPETFKNAPVGLQLVGQNQEDEAVIAMTEIVDAALRSKLHDRQ
jgi:Asp-tRNA(Asn)/Glu-tRNA(Gln) amidotransferase A subunit family amidase